MIIVITYLAILFGKFSTLLANWILQLLVVMLKICTAVGALQSETWFTAVLKDHNQFDGQIIINHRLLTLQSICFSDNSSNG